MKLPEFSVSGLAELRQQLQTSQNLILGIVFGALLLDNILLTVVGKLELYLAL